MTWDGPRLPYVETLFLPIFQGLQSSGIAAHVLQFGWSDRSEVERIAGRCEAAGVPYRYQRVWRHPISIGSLATAFAGQRAVAQAIADWSIDVVLPRSYLPALAAIPPARRAGCAVMLEADGLPNDERLEFAGVSRGSMSFRLLDRLERWAVRSSDTVTVRTADAANILAKRAGVPSDDRFTVVTNGRDESHFRPASAAEREQVRRKIGVGPSSPLAIFVGSSVSGKYHGRGLLNFLTELRKIDHRSRLLIVTPDLAAARNLVSSAGPDAEACLTLQADSRDVRSLIGAADVGLSLIHPSPSMRGASAIKTGEYLLCGIPVVATAEVGGVERILTPETGFIVRDEAGLVSAAQWFVKRALPCSDAFRTHCRELGLRHYSLTSTLGGYRAAIRMAERLSARSRAIRACGPYRICPWRRPTIP